MLFKEKQLLLNKTIIIIRDKYLILDRMGINKLKK